MAMWSCPHCGAPQQEADRCWVCRRSSVCCATCRHVRQAVVADVSYCGLDRSRTPLRGDEVRPCWETARTAADPNDRSIHPVAPGLIQVGGPPHPEPPPGPPTDHRWTLFVDLEA